MKRTIHNKFKLSQTLALKGATTAMKIVVLQLRRLKHARKPERYLSFDSLTESLLGGARVRNVFGFQRVSNEPVHEHVRALPGLARCIIGRGDGAARTADPFSDSSAEPMDIDPEPIDMEPESMEIDSEPMYMESQSVAITIIMTWI